MLFGNRYGSYRSNSNDMLSTLILLVLISFLAYYAYNQYKKQSEKESAITDADEKQIKSLVDNYEAELRKNLLKTKKIEKIHREFVPMIN